MRNVPTVVVGSVGIFLVSMLPQVPSDRDEVVRQAESSTRRIPDATRTEAINGLIEVRDGLAANPGELGDIAPDGAVCGALADEMTSVDASITRTEAILEYLKAKRTTLDDRAARTLDSAYEIVTLRTSHGRLAPERYVNVRRFVDARGVAISAGMTRAQRTKDAVRSAAAAANDTRDAAKTGTG